jgi:hyaluronoglucosaminidase
MITSLSPLFAILFALAADAPWSVAQKQALGIAPLPQIVNGSGQEIVVPAGEILVDFSDFGGVDDGIRQDVSLLLEEWGMKAIHYDLQVPSGGSEATRKNIWLFVGNGGARQERETMTPTPNDIRDRMREAGYILTVTQDHEGLVVISCWAETPQATAYGLVTLRQLAVLREGSLVLRNVTIQDWPEFRYRGVLEGGGEVWRHEERMALMPFMKRWKMNSYIYAPKGDPNFRRKWRKPYSSKELRLFRSEVEEAEKNRVVYGFSLSPGVSSAYVSQKSQDVLCQKFAAMQDMGIAFFGLFYDDIMPVMGHPDDLSAFSGLGEAQCYQTNKVLSFLKARGKVDMFFFCPTQYAGTARTRYVEQIAHGLDPSIVVGWTGPTICSYEIPLKDTEAFVNMIQHPVSIGDNHPVAGGNCMGALRNRDPNLAKVCDGFLSNPVSHSEIVSEIAVATMADYEWNPDEYDADWSLERSLMSFASTYAGSHLPEEAYPWLRVLAEQHQVSCCGFGKASALRLAYEGWLQGQPTLDALTQELRLCSEAGDVLSKVLIRPDFLDTVEEDLDALQDLGLKGLGCLEGIKVENEEAKATLAELMKTVR